MPFPASQVLQSVANTLPHLSLGAGAPWDVARLSAQLRDRGGDDAALACAWEALGLVVLGAPEAQPYSSLDSWLRGASLKKLEEALTLAAVAAGLKQVLRSLLSWPLDAGTPGEAELDALLYAEGVRGALRETALRRLRAEVLGEGTAGYGALSGWLRQAGPDELRAVFARAARRKP